MRKIALSVMIAMPSILFAWPEGIPALVCSGVTTSTTAITASSQQLSAYIDNIQVIVTPPNTTCAVTIASSGGYLAPRTIATISAATGTNMIRPFVQGTSNTTGIAWYRKEMLASDQLVVSASTATTVTNITVTTKAVIERQP